MATESQILANRRNALLSTGPRSAEGKAASRFNALKTGIEAKSQVIPGEDPAELQQLTADYHREFRPATPLERFLIDALVNAEWQLRRYHRIEARVWEQALSAEASNLGEAYERHLQTFTRLHRRIEAAERSYYRALQELRRLRAAAADDEASLPDLLPTELSSADRGPVSPAPLPRAAVPDSVRLSPSTGSQ